MDRVVVTRAIIGICHMQVCVAKGTEDDEILDVCNRENPSGTMGGWSQVIREKDPIIFGEKMPNCAPAPCGDYPEERIHLLVEC